jgi:S-adenosylmethionine-diacylgycerolhomoserine-N-methlytransferase
MTLFSDLRTLYQLVIKPVRGNTHAQRLESFYAPQAEDYDRFRRKLLVGREELYGMIIPPAGGTWIDMGAGTGANLEMIDPWKLQRLTRMTLVDLCPGLLRVARRRVDSMALGNVELLEADATCVPLPEASADVVTFSYSLSMIPDFVAALEEAYRLLKPGGLIGVVDFYVSQAHPAHGAAHSWLTRTFWPAWFAWDSVHLHPHSLNWLARKFEVVFRRERRARVPWMPLGRVPVYQFVGRKPVAGRARPPAA